MKKLLSILLAAVLLLALSAPALANASEPRIVYTPSAGYEAIQVDDDPEDGLHLEIRASDPDKVNEEGLLAAAGMSEAVKGADSVTFEVLDVVMVRDSTGEVVEWHEPIQVVITYDKSSQVIAVFHQEDDGTWNEIPFEIGDGTITLYLPHLSTVAFVYTEKSTTPVNPDDGGGDTDGEKSPQTGYDTVLWFALAAVFAAGAVFSFVRAGRKAERRCES